MNEGFIIHHEQSGEILVGGSGPPGIAALQPVPDGCAVQAVDESQCMNIDHRKNWWTGQSIAGADEAQIGADKTAIVPGEPITLTVPEDAWVLMNDVLAQASGDTFVVQWFDPGLLHIQLAGCYWSEVIEVMVRELPDWEERLLAQVDAQANDFALRFSTPGDTQQQRYDAKYADAWAFVADKDAGDAPDINDDVYAFLKDEADLTGQSPEDAAAAIIAARAASRARDVRIERARRSAKVAVRLAGTAQDKVAAAQVDWESLLS